jgi:hypothetical protein
MYQQLGGNPEWMASSPGIEAMNKFNESANIQRFNSRLGTIGALAPQEQGRRQFEYTAPVQKAQALGGEQRAYYNTLAGASALGRMDPMALQAGLGGNPDQYRGMMTNLGANAQNLAFGAKQQDRQQTMAGVGGLAGTIAGQVGSLGQADRIAKAIREQSGGAAPSYYTV